MSTIHKLKKIREFLLKHPSAKARLEFDFPNSQLEHMTIPLENYEELEFFSDHIPDYDLISINAYETLVTKHVSLSIRSLPKLNFYTEPPTD